MFKFILRAVLFTTILSSSIIPVFAWDDSGHKLTAYIAWQRMTPEVRDKVFKILLAAPEDSQLATFYMLYGSQKDEIRKRDFFMQAAVWADLIKDAKFDTRNKKYNNGKENSTWHYFDTRWTDKDGKAEILPSPGDEGGKLMQKLADFDKVIRSTASNSEKALAVAWLLHLIGDLHQPLHTSGRVTDYKGEENGDQGGNTFWISPRGGDIHLKLHQFWDGIIGQNMPNTADACDSDYLVPIGQMIMKSYPYGSLQSRLAEGKYEVWEKESVDIAMTEVYRGIKRDQLPSDEYKTKAYKISQERLALAGYRMGDLFNDIFGTPKTAVATAGDGIPCQMIRKVMYPVTQTSSVKQTLEIGLLDLCPTVSAARPMYSFMIDGKMVMKEYDVIKIFKTEQDARKYAADNKITDVNY